MALHPWLQILANAGLYDPPEHHLRPANGSPGGAVPAPGTPEGQRYAAAALVTECERVAGTAEGGRNQQLNTSSYRMGQLVALGYLSPQAAEAALYDAAQACGLPGPEASATVRSGLGAGERAPRAGIELRADQPVPAAWTVDFGSGPGALPGAPGALPTQVSEGEHDQQGERVQSIMDGLPAPVDWHQWWATVSVEPDWLVPDILERGRSHVIYAPHKAGKSLITLSWCGQLARAGVHVLYVDLENAPADVVERLQDMGYAPEDLATLHYFSFPSMAALDTPLGGAQLTALAQMYTADLVILDTTARVVTGKENESDTYRALYRCALVPLKAAGVTVLRLDHAGKDPTAGQRGSSGKGDDVDVIWLLIRHDETRYVLKCDAQRSGHHPQLVELRLQESPLRFQRVTEDPFSRPKVAACVDALDRLQVPSDAGRVLVREALAKIGFKISNRDLGDAIKARTTTLDEADKSPEKRSGSAPAELIMDKIDIPAPQDQLDFEVPPAHRAPGALPERSEREAGATETRALPGAPPLRGGALRGARAQAAPEPNPEGLVCDRCRLPADRLIPGTRGQSICPVCAYPNPADRPGHPQEDE